jgi:hypothetical protein
MELLQPPLTEEAARLLRAVGVRHVVTRTDTAWPEVARFGEERIAEVPPGEAARPVPGGTTQATLWTPEGIVIDNGGPGILQGVTFELDESAWIADPRVEVSPDGLAWTAVRAHASLADATLSLMRDPRHGRGAVRFPPSRARYVRLDPRLPARAGPLELLSGPP